MCSGSKAKWNKWQQIHYFNCWHIFSFLSKIYDGRRLCLRMWPQKWLMDAFSLSVHIYWLRFCLFFWCCIFAFCVRRTYAIKSGSRLSRWSCNHQPKEVGYRDEEKRNFPFWQSIFKWCRLLHQPCNIWYSISRY